MNTKNSKLNSTERPYKGGADDSWEVINKATESEVVSDELPLSEKMLDESSAEAVVTDELPVSEKMLDLVFLIDCTASMQSFIDVVKANVKAIFVRLSQESNCDVRFGLVAYRDHPPQDTTYITKTFDFTRNTATMQENVDGLMAKGGGDGPEAVTAALHKTEHLDWRRDATKFVVLIADAPPHGLGEYGDGFPNGDPDGLDPLEIARSMASKGITVYVVGCEPALSNYMYARTFFCALAEMTTGLAFQLASAALLPDIILGGAKEEMNLKKLSDYFEKQMRIAKSELELEKRMGKVVLDEDLEISNRIFGNVKKEKIRTSTMVCDGVMKDENAKIFRDSPSLSSIRGKIPCSSSHHTRIDHCTRVDAGDFLASSRGPSSATSCVSIDHEVSVDQCRRMVSKKMAQGKI